MSRSYWLQIGLAGFLLSVALLVAWSTQPNAPSNYERESENKRFTSSASSGEEANNLPDFRFYEPIEARLQSRNETRTPSQKPDETERNSLTLPEADLLAQERVAHWTAWIGGFTAIGLIALVMTLIETMQVTAITRDIGKAQVRAYLQFDVKDVRASPDEDRAGHTKISFIGVIRNTGQSPAYAYRVLYDIEAAESYPVTKRRRDGSDFRNQPGAAFALAGASDVNQRLTKSLPVRVEDIRSGQLSVKLDYMIKYIDVFNDEVETPVCSGVVRSEKVTGKLVFAFNRIVRIEDAEND